jgi:hypothetical protein
MAGATRGRHHGEGGVTKLYVDSDKFGYQAASPTVEAYHGAIKDLVRSKLATFGGDWNSFVFDKSYELITADEMRKIEKLLIDAGHRFDWSAAISPRERPDIYKPGAGASDASINTFSFRHPEAKTYIRTPDKVLQFLTEGVPVETIAVIDDSGGTLTAPILAHFKAVICAGGTVRSHLGILTREWGVPCLMNAKISGIHDGDTVELEVTAAAKTAEAYQTGVEMTANVWRLKKA